MNGSVEEIQPREVEDFENAITGDLDTGSLVEHKGSVVEHNGSLNGSLVEHQDGDDENDENGLFQ